jgi:hypothetical protein
MSLAKAEAKINNIDRVVTYGKKDKLELVDKATREVLAKVKLWSWKKLNPAQQGAPTYLFRLAADATTREILPSCDIAFNGTVHDVVNRSEPESVSGIEWTLRTRPTMEVIDA